MLVEQGKENAGECLVNKGKLIVEEEKKKANAAQCHEKIMGRACC